MNRLITFLATLLLSAASNLYAAHNDDEHAAKVQCAHEHGQHAALRFAENKGQWHSNVLYRLQMGGLNTLFLEQQTLTYIYFNAAQVAALHDLTAEQRKTCRLSGHTYKVHFLNALAPKNISGEEKSKDYENYFVSNNPAHWASNVHLYKRINYTALYKGIDLAYYSEQGRPKYDFIVAPNASPEQIQLQYEGADYLRLDDGKLIIGTSVETIAEQQPYAYQLIEGKKRSIPCHFALQGKVVSFVFPQGYNPRYTLVIDPVLVAATLSGSSVTNYGHCATFDNEGNIYTGAISFGPGYSTSPGAFDTTFGGGFGVDIAVSKYDPEGTTRLYGTYLGGGGGDYPHSLIVDNDFQLHVYGTTDATDYPTTNDAYDTTFGGGVADMVISILNTTGTALIGSTYIGGSGNDGRNNININYGDTYRGEIMTDIDGNTYVAGCSGSGNFPVTTGVIDAALGGQQDGVLVKLNEDLSELEWATYIGGTGVDIAYGVRVAEDNTIYVCGSTTSGTGFPMAASGATAQATYAGGEYDGFILHLNPDATQILHSTFRGTNNVDQAHFIDIDDHGNQIMIYGQTLGNMPITPAGIYGVNNATQYITAYPYDLSTINYNTRIGAAGGGFGYSMVPVAFMVDKCGFVYFSGYSLSGDFDLSPDALYNIGGFYLGVLEPGFVALDFATYYSEGHVDGGTSRFDNNGIVYQGVCSGGNFTTTPDAWATDQTSGWDIGVFKIDFEAEGVNAQASAAPEISGCAPLTVNFSNLGSEALDYFWDFDDGTSSTIDEPTHTFTQSGIYEVMLIGSDPLSCNLSDTANLLIVVLDNESEMHAITHCQGSGNLTANVTLPISSVTYIWSDGVTTPSRILTSSGMYAVTTTYSNCMMIDSFDVNIIESEFDFPSDTTVCATSLLLDFSVPGASNYVWQDGTTGPTYNVTQSGTYFVGAQIQGCQVADFINVTLISQQPLVIDDQSSCGSAVTLNATLPNASNYLWSTGETNAIITVNQAGNYTVTVNVGNLCVQTEDVNVSFGDFIIDLGSDKSICEGDTHTFGQPPIVNTTYLWNNGSTTAQIQANQAGTYILTALSNGCEARDTVDLAVISMPTPPISDQIVCDGVPITLNASTNGSAPATYLWNDGLTTATRPVLAAGNYNVTVTYDGLCTASKSISVVFENLQVNIGNDTLLCEGLTQTFGETIPGASYAWSNGSTNPQIDVDDAATYTVTVSLNGCVVQDAATLDLSPLLTPFSLGEDEELCLGESLQLAAPAGSGLSYLWNDGSTVAQRTVSEAGVYRLQVTGACNMVEDEINITVNSLPNPENPILLPNAFSPNNDGINDELCPLLTGLSGDYKFHIYNRWGQLVFETTTPGTCWNGKFKGQDAEIGVYVWQCWGHVALCRGERDVQVKGNISVIR